MEDGYLLKLMYITNNVDVAKIAENNGVDRIFVDLEVIGKKERQGGMDTVQSNHNFDDIKKIKNSINKSELLVRSNPIHYNSEEEINNIVNNGSDIIMLPYFKTTKEVEHFINLVNGRCKTMLLVETAEAVKSIDEILDIDGIDEIHIGLNDLHLDYKMKFMFELLVDGTVEYLCNKFKNKNIPYGFGGIAGIGEGTLPAENIIQEHYRLGSTRAILSRSFCNTDKIKDLNKINEIFTTGLRKIRDFENKMNELDFEENKILIKQIVEDIVYNKSI